MVETSCCENAALKISRSSSCNFLSDDSALLLLR
uniref:Uncharacterized protein n=1 Tax=Setaria italica TaxID=4555 RepID=K4A3S4_SETIT